MLFLLSMCMFSYRHGALCPNRYKLLPTIIVKQSREINTQFVNLLRSKSKAFLNYGKRDTFWQNDKQHRLNYTRIGAASMFFNHHIQFSLNYYFVSLFLSSLHPRLLFTRRIRIFLYSSVSVFADASIQGFVMFFIIFRYVIGNTACVPLRIDYEIVQIIVSFFIFF